MISGPTVFDGVDSLLSAAGTDLGTSRWYTIAARDAELFDRATGGGGVAAVRPFMLLALSNRFLPELLQVRGASSGINYGTGSVRFVAEVRAGDRLRARATLVEAEVVPAGVQTSVEIRLEVDGRSDPVCVVESLSRWLR